MGSATTQALSATTAALDAAAGVDLDTARELFAAARIVGDSSQLSGALADPTAPVYARTRVVTDVFGGTFSKATVSLLTTGGSPALVALGRSRRRDRRPRRACRRRG